MNCEKCEKTLEVGDWPFCPHGKGVNSVIPDEIPGGYIVYHGICNEDGSPRKYYSKSEMAKEAKRKGLVNSVRHITNPKDGTDKNPHTTRWI